MLIHALIAIAVLAILAALWLILVVDPAQCGGGD